MEQTHYDDYLNEFHSESVSPITSLDMPTNTIKIPKKVSFSDGQIKETKFNKKYLNNYSNIQKIDCPVTYHLKETEQYLKQLHDDHQLSDKPNHPDNINESLNNNTTINNNFINDNDNNILINSIELNNANKQDTLGADIFREEQEIHECEENFATDIKLIKKKHLKDKIEINDFNSTTELLSDKVTLTSDNTTIQSINIDTIEHIEHFEPIKTQTEAILEIMFNDPTNQQKQYSKEENFINNNEGKNSTQVVRDNICQQQKQQQERQRQLREKEEEEKLQQLEVADYKETYNFNLDKSEKNYSAMELEAKYDKIRWLLISECSALLGDSKHTWENFKKEFLDEKFLRKFFHLFDLSDKGYILHDRWIEHLKGRLTEHCQMDYIEEVESIAYVVCGESNQITYQNFHDIWQAHGILNKFYQLIDVDGMNLISTNQIMEFISHLTNTRARIGFDKTSLARLEQLFRNTVGNEQEIRREEFKKIVTSKNPFFTERVFQIFDKDNSGSISLQEFIDSIHQFSGQSADDKIRFLFKVYDIDGDGLIQHKELHAVIRACMIENGMNFSEDQIEDLTTAMFEDADPYNRGEITYEALKNQLHKHGGLVENLSITIDRWLVPLSEEKSNSNENKGRKCCICIPIPHQLTKAYMKNNHVFVTYLLIYTIINICLFITRAVQYRASNPFIILARACGQCLNFNCAWVLVLMLRHSITYLRSRGLSILLPIDNHIYLHKMTGIVISILSFIHTIMHLLNFSIIVINDVQINTNNYTIVEWLFTNKPRLFGLIPGWANPTGIILFIILLVIFICSQSFVRRKGSFEIFYWTHLLYIPFWILCLFHGPNFWKWFLLPGIIYTIERILRFVWMRTEHGKTYITSGILLPSKVIHLVIKRPQHFNFTPGDYIFINIPSIAKYEWHPFTISSAPEQEDYMWLHIRTAGEWTNRLYQYFEKEQQKLHNSEIIPKKESTLLSLNEIRTENRDSILSPTLNTSSVTSQKDFLIKCCNQIHGNSYTLHENQQQQSETMDKYKNYVDFVTTKLSTEDINAKDKNELQNISVGISTLDEVQNNGRNRNLARIFHRTFSSKENEFTPRSLFGQENNGFVIDADEVKQERFKKLGRIMELKMPTLEKSRSLPDMANKFKASSKIYKTRHVLDRSESECPQSQYKMRCIRRRSIDLAYLNPQNKSLAQSFRYMRNKPTIIALRTPDNDNNDDLVDSPNEKNISKNINQLNTKEYESKIEKDNVTFLNIESDGNNENSKNLNSTINLAANNRVVDRLRRPTFLRSLSTSIKNHGSNGSLPSNGATNPNSKVTLDAGVLEIFIDGPYGAPSSHIFMAQHAVLIATGIGVTPFASILQSIMHRYWKARHMCPRCQFEWSSDIPKTVMNLRKVDFFWINRNQRSFEWFVNLLSQLEIEQAELGGPMERFLDMHMYITSALQRTDMKAVGLQLALDLLHEKAKLDLITGLKTRTNAGRPNWDKVFKKLKAQKKGKITIFYCGPAQLAKTLRYKCDEYGFAFRKECF